MDIFITIILILGYIVLKLNSLNRRMRILELKYEKLKERLDNHEKQMDIKIRSLECIYKSNN